MTDRPTKPVLDAQTFQKVLEAAFILQEHKRKSPKAKEKESVESKSKRRREEDHGGQIQQPKAPSDSEPAARANTDYTLTLAEIVEAQHYIRAQRLDVEAAMNVVADRLAWITKASGAGIGILDGNIVRYRAGAGSPALPVGTEVPLGDAICQPTVRTGQVIRSIDVDTEFLFDPVSVRGRGIRSLVAVPIHYDGEIVGGLELYFDKIQGYAEQDVHTCQLMAGLVTEALGCEAGLKLKKSMAEERSSMRAALEKLEPNLAELAKSPSDDSGAMELPKGIDQTCWKCASTLSGEEQFCGSCGAPRTWSEEEAATIQSKLAASWDALAEPEKTNGRSFKTAAASSTGISRAHAEASSSAEPISDVLPDDVLAMFPAMEVEENFIGSSSASNAEQENLSSESEGDSDDSAVSAETEGSESNENLLVWSSAARAQDFLESLSLNDPPSALVRFWRFRRGDFYLAVAVALVVAVIGWGIWSNHLQAGSANTVSRTAKHTRRSSPDSDLSMFDRLLIDIGLAEAPDPAPEYKGNPDVQVWVDLNTAQYYCPGADFYQKTPNGKLTNQRQAQLDQFQPASLKACD